MHLDKVNRRGAKHACTKDHGYRDMGHTHQRAGNIAMYAHVQ